MIETTLALIKPDAVQNRAAGHILQIMEAHFVVCDVMCTRWGGDLFRRFYHEHWKKPFFEDLVNFMASDRVYAVTLVEEGAVKKWREIMGATDPKKADPGTVREMFGSKTGPIMHNAVHGSDSARSAMNEIALFGLHTGSTFGSVASIAKHRLARGWDGDVYRKPMVFADGLGRRYART